MNIRSGILLVLAMTVLASYAVAYSSDDAKQVRVEVEKEDGVAKVKVYETKDGEEVLVKEFETEGDPHEVLELEGDADVFIMRADDGHTWTARHGDHGTMKKIMKIKGDDMVFFSGPRAFLGISMQTLNEQLAEYFGAEGVLVQEIVEDSPAEEAGLKAGDVIVKMDGEDVEDTDDVAKFMSDREKGDEVEIKVRRKGKNKSFKVTLGEQENNDFAFHGMPHMEYFDHDGDHEVIMRRLHGDDSEELENLRADVEELRAMLEEMKKDK